MAFLLISHMSFLVASSFLPGSGAASVGGSGRPSRASSSMTAVWALLTRTASAPPVMDH
jgi:hypothetical protein